MSVVAAEAKKEAHQENKQLIRKGLERQRRIREGMVPRSRRVGSILPSQMIWTLLWTSLVSLERSGIPWACYKLVPGAPVMDHPTKESRQSQFSLDQ